MKNDKELLVESKAATEIEKIGKILIHESFSAYAISILNKEADEKTIKCALSSIDGKISILNRIHQSESVRMEIDFLMKIRRKIEKWKIEIE